MKTLPWLKVALLGGSMLCLSLACGRSWVFDAVDDGSSGTAGAGSTSAGSSGGVGSSGGSAAGGRTSGGSSSAGSTSAGSSTGSPGCRGQGRRCGGGNDCCSGLQCQGGRCAPAESSSSSTGAGVSSSSTGGGGCIQGPAQNELTPCQSDAQCVCPLTCASSALGVSLCEYACGSTSDCPSLYTTCQSGTCQLSLCGTGFGGGTIDGTCNAAGQNDGTCLPVPVGGFTLGICYEGGQATTTCDPLATRQDASQACPPGSFCTGLACQQLCNPNGSVSCNDGSSCIAPLPADPQLGICGGLAGGIGGNLGGNIGGNIGGAIGGNSSGGSAGGCGGPPPPCSCPAGCFCAPICTGSTWTCESTCGNGASSGGNGGGCGGPPPVCACGPGCTGQQSCVNGSWECACSCTTGGSNGGTTCGPDPCPSCGVGCTNDDSCDPSGNWTCACGCGGGTGGSACNPTAPVQEFGPCQSTADCACPLSCVPDAVEGQVCEYACTQTSECPSLYDVCTGTSCTVDLCGVPFGGPPNGKFDGPCNVEGTDDGTCLPGSVDDAGFTTYGICELAGTATTSCSASATRQNLSEACGLGYTCAPSTANGSDICWEVCNPVSGSKTLCSKKGQTCTAFDQTDPELGVCYPP